MPKRRRRLRKRGRKRGPMGAADSSVATGYRPNSLVQLPRNYLLPDRLRVCFRYTENLSYGAAVNSTQVYRGNSIFDPNESGTGGQPYGHDQFATLYNNYFVESSMIEFKFLLTSNTAVGIAMAPTKATTSTYEELAQHPMVRLKTMYGGTSNGVWGTLKSSARTHNIENKMDDAHLYAAFGANPANVWRWHHRVRSLDGATNHSGAAEVVITYNTILWQRQDLGTSLDGDDEDIDYGSAPKVVHVLGHTPAKVLGLQIATCADRGDSKGDTKSVCSEDEWKMAVAAVPVEDKKEFKAPAQPATMMTRSQPPRAAPTPYRKSS